MDKYEFNVCIEEINNLIKQKEYTEAVNIADTIDWKNVKSANVLCRISDLYKKCGRYEDSRDVLMLAYQRNPNGRMIVYSLCELSIKVNDIQSAVSFYKEYAKLAPKETNCYILKYKIYAARNVDIEERIKVLEELQRQQCYERWMYELAYLYHQLGDSLKCIDECDQIVLFFGEGKYVIKALELKATYGPIPEQQQELYRRLTSPIPDEIVMHSVDVSAIDLQKELAENMREVMAESPVAPSHAEPEENKNEPTQDTAVFKPLVFDKKIEIENFDETNIINTSAVKRELTRINGDVEVLGNTKPIELPKEFTEPVEEKPSVPPRYLSDEEPVKSDVAPAVKRVVEPDAAERSKPGMWGMHEFSIGDSNSAIKYPSYEDMVSVQGDGQIAFVMPEEEKIDKQITGQISINDIMLEWERMKEETNKRWEEDVRKRLQKSTDDLFKNFDENRGGLLETLQNSINEPEEVTIFEEEPKEQVEENRPLEQEESVSVDEPAAVEEQPETVEMPSFEPGAIVAQDMREFFVDVDQDEEQETEELTAEPVFEETETKETDDDPSEEELTFDRTPFVGREIELEQEVESNLPEPPSEDNTISIPSLDEYLNEYAEAVEKRNQEQAAYEKGLYEAIDEMSKAIIETQGPDYLDGPDEEFLEESGEEIVEESAEEISEEEPEEVTEVAMEEPEETTEETIDEEAETEDQNAEESSENAEVAEEVAKEEAIDTESSLDTPEVSEEFGENRLDIFENFIQKEEGLVRIKSLVNVVSTKAGEGNMIVTSEDRDSAVELGRAFIMDLSERGEITGKVAKVKASSLNTKDPESIIDGLKDGGLIIIEANELKKEVLEIISKKAEEPDGKIFIVLTMNRRVKNQFLSANSSLLDSFTAFYDVEALSNNQLVEFATKYAFSREFAIDDLGILELHRRIDEMTTHNHRVTTGEVKEIVDGAITHAVRKTIPNFVKSLIGKRYAENAMIVLSQRDFEE